MDIIAKAAAKRDSLLAELQELSAFLRVAERLRGEDAPAPAARAAAVLSSSRPIYEELDDGQDDDASLLDVDTAPRRTRRETTPRSSPGILAQTAAAVEDILREAGHPILTDDMLQRLQARGVTVGGKNASATLHARLHGVASLVHSRQSGWSLSEPVPDQTQSAQESAAAA